MDGMVSGNPQNITVDKLFDKREFRVKDQIMTPGLYEKTLGSILRVRTGIYD